MESLRRFLAIVGADLLERGRSRRFWLALALVTAAAWWSFPSVDAGYLVLALNGHYRALYSSAWIGMVVAMLSIWLSLIGFYLVRGTLVRDIETRVWQLLVATPLTRAAYLLAKWCSHMAVLSLIAGAALLVGLLAQWVRGEDAVFDLAELVKPVLLLAMPSLALTATFAVWFDLAPWLRRTAGNVLYFALWVAILAASAAPPARVPGGASVAPVAGHVMPGDPRGILLARRAIQQQVGRQLDEPLQPGFCMRCGLGGRAVRTFHWNAWALDWTDVAGRLFWLGAAVAGVVLAAPWMDRAGARAGSPRSAGASGGGRPLRWLDRLLAPLQGSVLGALVAAELQRNLRQRPWWWWGALAAAMLVGVLAPLAVAALGVLAAWMLLLDLYSRAALHEQESRTGAIVFCAAGGGRRVLLARWLMLAALGCAVNLPALLRLLLVAPASALALLAVCASLASWALALGVLTRNARIFELLVCLFAYLALNGVPALNVAADPLRTALSHLALLAPACALAWWGWTRARRV